MTQLLKMPTGMHRTVSTPAREAVFAADRRRDPSPLPTPARTGHAPPAILLGGGVNALSVARSLGRSGVAVYSLNDPGEYVRYSRYCRPIDVTDWAAWLLGPESNHLRGAVLLACCDAGIELIMAHGPELRKKFLLDDSNSVAQRRMLNKLLTYEAARQAGVPTPKFWLLHGPDDLPRLRDELVYPLLIKPRLSHLFEQRTGKKYLAAQDFEQATAAVREMLALGSDIVLMEMIPGPDSELCSYFTYLDEQHRPLFHFTKRIIRRFKPGMGNGCYHVTDWIPELVDLANRLFSHVELQGLTNVEFKRDARDGQYKLIECNARFTASDPLVTRSGINLGLFVYNRLTGRPLPAMDKFQSGLRLWDPVRDFQCCRVLRQRGEMTYLRWFKSVLHRQTFPYFHWSDPLPSLMRWVKPLRWLAGR